MSRRDAGSFLWPFAFVSALTGCGTNGDGDGDGNGNGDGSGSGNGSGSGSGDVLTPPARGFQVVTPEIELPPHTEKTYCYYFKTPNTELLSIKKWSSVMSEGSHHMILYFTQQLGMPEGTMNDSGCGLLSGGVSNIPSWVYSAQTSPQTLELPADDGTGTPVGMDVPAGQAAYLELHYNNPNDTPLTIKGTVNGEAYDAGITTTKTFAYITYDSDISLAPMQPNQVESLQCNLGAASKVWMMSTHAHKRATKTEVKNGSEVVFASNDWEHPGAREWKTAPFYSFTSNKLTVTCTYYNNTSMTIVDGESAETDEMCMASGYVFPATKSTICFNGFVL